MKKVKTNSKVVREAIRAHILESVYNYDTEQPFETVKEACAYLNESFEQYYDSWRQARHNRFDVFDDWMQGLPFSFMYYFDEQKQFFNDLGLFDPKGDDSGRTRKLFHHLIYMEMEKNK